MNYIIYDLEFNQKYLSDTSEIPESPLKFPFEIIQIGALKLNENFETISTFNTLIKPTVYPVIHPYVENLTKITNDKLFSCETFPKVYKDFIQFIGTDECVFCVWGLSDMKELIRNVKFHNLSTSLIPKKYIDVQKYASKRFNIPKGLKIGLKTTVELLNIEFNDNFHDAYYDAYYTKEIFKIIYIPNMTPKTYNFNPIRRTSTPKEKIDTKALINQFEKMYNREMSEEEKAIIKLSYMMGKTNQFKIKP
ncbi:3'-5' exonuclease [Clostridium hydrogeniformans]|uniref:3'-5' exonuclease n=1 Tax=Clostridium hydrogeniformans TaxID=349933 RepID=UPI000489D370|nr:3'-5' exonuclease [Clostridium hydrogeniformans]